MGEELRRGEVRQGLWAKALSGEAYDQQRAKAKYIKLRVRVLRRELADAVHREQLLAQEETARQKDEAIQVQVQSLEWRSAGLKRSQRFRSSVRIVAFLLPFLVVTALRSPPLEEAALIGLLAGACGFVIAEIVRWLMPSQWRLSREESAIQTEREAVEWAQKSWLERTLSNIFEAALGFAVICFLIYQAVKHFAK